MDNVQSPEILDITLSSNQNGASLGEQKKGSNEAKPSVSKVRYRFQYLTEFFLREFVGHTVWIVKFTADMIYCG